jgi:arylsulfatase A-like enzyme
MSFISFVLLGITIFTAPDPLYRHHDRRPNHDVNEGHAQDQNAVGEQGTTFSNSFVSFSQCCPSRATFLTGQYPHNHGVWDIRPPLGGYAKFNGTNTLTLWLQSAGYFTSHIGKYLNGYGVESPDQEVPPGWDHWQGLVDPTT